MTGSRPGRRRVLLVEADEPGPLVVGGLLVDPDPVDNVATLGGLTARAHRGHDAPGCIHRPRTVAAHRREDGSWNPWRP